MYSSTLRKHPSGSNWARSGEWWGWNVESRGYRMSSDTLWNSDSVPPCHDTPCTMYLTVKPTTLNREYLTTDPTIYWIFNFRDFRIIATNIHDWKLWQICFPKLCRESRNLLRIFQSVLRTYKRIKIKWIKRNKTVKGWEGSSSCCQRISTFNSLKIGCTTSVLSNVYV